MSKYNLGGGISGEAKKVDYRKSMKWEDGKSFTFNAIDKSYVNFLSCVKSVTVKGKRMSKSDLTFNLVKKLYVSQEKKTKSWTASDKK